MLCEGVMDAMAIQWNAIPLFGKTLPPKLQQKIIENHVTDIYIALDNDIYYKNGTYISKRRTEYTYSRIK